MLVHGGLVLCVAARVVRETSKAPTVYELQEAMWFVLPDHLPQAGRWLVHDGHDRLEVTGAVTMVSIERGELANVRIVGRVQALGDVVISVRGE